MSDQHGILVLEAAQGTAGAIDSLLVQLLPRLRAFIRLRCGEVIRNRESCSDLAQSVCREVLEDMAGFEYRGDAAFRAWLFATALNKIRKRGRYYAAPKRKADESAWNSLSNCYSEIVTPSRIAIRHEEIAQLERGFDELPDHYREAITLQKIAGLSYAEVGDRMGKSEDAVRGLLERAMKQLTWILSRGCAHDS